MYNKKPRNKSLQKPVSKRVTTTPQYPQYQAYASQAASILYTCQAPYFLVWLQICLNFKVSRSFWVEWVWRMAVVLGCRGLYLCINEEIF